jgi:hypothetical protein
MGCVVSFPSGSHGNQHLNPDAPTGKWSADEAIARPSLPMPAYVYSNLEGIDAN